MVQNVSAYSSENGPPDGAMTSTSDNDEISVVIMGGFHYLFSWMTSEPLKLVV